MFGGMVRAYRLRLSMTQEELASRAGLSVRGLRKLEAGQVTRPQPNTVRLLADAFALTGEERDRFCRSAFGDGTDLPAGHRTPVPPRQLPATTYAFTGRAEELAVLDRLKDDSTVVVAALDGMAGVGKTALALRAAHLSRDDFPDGQLYVDLGGTRGNATDPGDVLGWFLRSLGNAEQDIPGRLDERECLYRSQLAGRRMLVVLDNVASYSQVRPLLPGDPSCRVILTCRGRLSELPGVTRVEVDVLAPAQAIELFATIVGEQRVVAEPAAARQIVELCGRLSIGIRVAAARLIARPHWSLRYLAQRLADERCRLNELRLGTLDVRARIDGSYQQLTAESQVALRRLALLESADFPIGAAARVLDVSSRVGEEVAESLIDARLLEIAGSDGARRQRHRFNGLVRVFAREKADPADRRMMAGRFPLSVSPRVPAA